MRKKVESRTGWPESFALNLAIAHLTAKKINLDEFTPGQLKGIKALAFCALRPELLFHDGKDLDRYWTHVRDLARALYKDKPTFALRLMLSIVEKVEKDPVLLFLGTRRDVIFDGKPRRVDDLTDKDISRFIKDTTGRDFSASKIKETRQSYNRQIVDLHLEILTQRSKR